MALTDFLPGLFRKADPEPAPAPEPVTLTDPLASWLFAAAPTYTGKSVTPATAMNVPAVSSAVELIAEAVGTLDALPSGGRKFNALTITEISLCRRPVLGPQQRRCRLPSTISMR